MQHARHVTLTLALGEDHAQGLNRVESWSRKDLVLDGRGPVGNKIKTTKLKVEAQRKKYLYPAYIAWCERHDVKAESLNRFRPSLIKAALLIWPGET